MLSLRLVIFVLVCFFNDTATTEIYTYLHTLSLHDALPISGRPAQPAAAVCRDPQPGAAGPRLSRKSASRLAGSMRWPDDMMGMNASSRSEEHTSELQLLMRISYAVFCLKKKIKQSRKIT